MNQTDLIKQLKLLGTIQPSPQALKDLKKDIDQRRQTESIEPTRFHRSLFIGMSFMVVLIIFVLSTSNLLQNSVHLAVLNIRIMTATNQYDKAKIALADSQYTYRADLATHPVTEISQSIKLTNTELSALKLKGETGKYSAWQCHELYLEYLAYLQELDHQISNIQSKNPPTVSQLKSQISTYEEQAERKLNLYEKL